MKNKIALITGITGQDGSYLAELLLKKGYVVHGIVRRASTFNRGRIEHLYTLNIEENKTFFLHYGDVSDPLNITYLFKKIQPDEVYHLAAQSHVKVSFEVPAYTGQVDALGTLNILEAVRFLDLLDKCKIYNASTSELFGNVVETPQKETTPFNPRSPYAVAKQYAYWSTKVYRDSYNLFACNGILFNHESPRRGENFVTRKITKSIANILHGKQKRLILGNLRAKRDWGYAPEYVEAMWMMLQQDKPDDFVIATGKSHEVSEFVQSAFACADIEIIWEGEGVDEVGINKLTGEVIVSVGEKYFRPTEVNNLQGDYSKAKKILGWEPKTDFDQLVRMMVEADLEIAKSQ